MYDQANGQTLIVHATGSGGTDAMTGKKNQDGLLFTFERAGVIKKFLSWRSLKQLLKLNVPTMDPTAIAEVSDEPADHQGTGPSLLSATDTQAG